MEKPGPGVAKSKIKFLMFLPKPATASASAVSLQNQKQHLFSPGKLNANKLKSHQNNKGFSGPITSIVFEEARNKSNGSSSRFDAREPTSPKISCMGQIKHRKKKLSKNKISSSSKTLLPKEVIIPKKTNPGSRNFFSSAKQGRKSDAAATGEKSSKLPDRAPSLSQMKRFASGHDTFSKFDYNKAQVVPQDSDDPRYYSGDISEEEEEDREPTIPFSAPILRGEDGPAAITLQPRKEINLWKRRTMAQPKPLKLN